MKCGGGGKRECAQVHERLGPAFLQWHVLPKIPLGYVLSYHKQKASCIYAGPWNVIIHHAWLSRYREPVQVCTVPNNNTQSCPNVLPYFPPWAGS